MPRVTIKNETNSGNRRGWTKWVQSVDATKTDGYAFVGSFLNDQEYDLPVGAVLVQKNPEGSAKHGYNNGVCLVVETDGSLRRTHADDFNWYRQFLTFRDHVAALFPTEPTADEVDAAVAELVARFGESAVREATRRLHD